MLRNLTDISNVSVIHKSSNENIYGAQKIQYDGNPVGSGGVGSVYKIENIDGKKFEGLLLKLISNDEFIAKTYDTISLLHTKINEKQKQTQSNFLIEYPEFGGLPFLVFKAKISETKEKVTGMIVQNLLERGYFDYGDESFKRINKNQFIDYTDKLYIAYQLARGIELLHELKFIHADLKDNSIFINLNIPQIAIIDYDGGFNYDKQSFALTIGALQSWASYTFRRAIGLNKAAKDFTVTERLDEEKWNLAVGIFEVFFATIPFYFLKDNEDETIKSYLKNNTWPDIPSDLTLFKENNLSFHTNLLEVFEALGKAGLKPLIDTFKNIFNSGYKNELKRLSPKQWKDLLFNLCVEFVGLPKIENFESKKAIIDFEGDTIEFKWSAKYYRSIQLNGTQIEQHITNKLLKLETDREVELLVVNDFGEARKFIKVSANRITPIIKKFEATISKRTDLTPVKLIWETKDVRKVLISQVHKELPLNGETEVNPQEKTNYILTAFGNFDQKISAELEIDVETPKINLFKYEINIEKGINNVDLFWETENAQEVKIIPGIGKVEHKGETYISIADRTEFTIIAKGYFNEITKKIEAQPFPIPIIKGLFVPIPVLNLENPIPAHLLEMQIPFIKLSNLNLDPKIEFSSIEPNFSELDKNLKELNDAPKIAPNSNNIFNRIFKK